MDSIYGSTVNWGFPILDTQTPQEQPLGILAELEQSKLPLQRQRLDGLPGIANDPADGPLKPR